MMEDQSAHSSERKPSEPTQVIFSSDLSEYIRTGVDPTGRYSKSAPRHEKRSFVLIYIFLGMMIIVGLLSGGFGRRLIEDLLRLIQGG